MDHCRKWQHAIHADRWLGLPLRSLIFCRARAARCLSCVVCRQQVLASILEQDRPISPSNQDANALATSILEDRLAYVRNGLQITLKVEDFREHDLEDLLNIDRVGRRRENERRLHRLGKAPSLRTDLPSLGLTGRTVARRPRVHTVCACAAILRAAHGKRPNQPAS